MEHYQQSLTVRAAPVAIYTALTTPQGLRGWWTRDCDVGTGVGGTLLFRFGQSSKEMQIERLEPGRAVHWRCTKAHIAAERLTRKDEWVGTQIIFRLTPTEDGQTRIDFEHIGLKPDFECYELCSNGWRHFLGSLHQFAETGQGTPYEIGAACTQ